MDIGKWLGKWETDGESVYFHESLMGDKLFTIRKLNRDAVDMLNVAFEHYCQLCINEGKEEVTKKVIKALQEAGLHG